MDRVKLFVRRTGEDVDQVGKVEKPKSPAKKAIQQPVKPKKAETGKKVAKKPEEPRTPLWERVRQYLREVSYELRKVVWPSRKETLGTTAVVLVLVLLSAAYLGLVDIILSRFIRVLLG